MSDDHFPKVGTDYCCAGAYYRAVETMPTLSGISLLRAPIEVVADLAARGLMPNYPQDVWAMEQQGVGRTCTLADAEGLEFLLAWKHGEVVGYAVYRDTFYYAGSYDGREIIGLCGTAQAMRALFKHLRDDARDNGRRIFGSSNIHNRKMLRLCKLFGGTATRIIYEDLR